MDIKGSEIVEILKACKEAGVVEMKLGELEVRFALYETQTGGAILNQLPSPVGEYPETLDEAIEQAQGDSRVDEIDEMNLILNDPEEWERMQRAPRKTEEA